MEPLEAITFWLGAAEDTSNNKRSRFGMAPLKTQVGEGIIVVCFFLKSYLLSWIAPWKMSADS